MTRVPRRTLIFAIPAAFGFGLPRVAGAARASEADHYGMNSITFEALKRPLPSGAKGSGEVEYDGGEEPKSRWSSSFRFSGMSPNTGYEVVVRGRFGENGTTEATEYSELCSFTTESDGSGSCFAYFRGLQRLDVVQVRQSDDGRRVMQASRSSSGLGSITTVPNRYTPAESRRTMRRARAK